MDRKLIMKHYEKIVIEGCWKKIFLSSDTIHKNYFNREKEKVKKKKKMNERKKNGVTCRG